METKTTWGKEKYNNREKGKRREDNEAKQAVCKLIKHYLLL